jgi:hypothetical protein
MFLCFQGLATQADLTAFLRGPRYVEASYEELLFRVRDGQETGEPLALEIQFQELEGLLQSCIFGHLYGPKVVEIIQAYLRCGLALSISTCILWRGIYFLEQLYPEGSYPNAIIGLAVQEELLLHRVMARLVLGQDAIEEANTMLADQVHMGAVLWKKRVYW